MATARENTEADVSERERHGTISWTHAFWVASRVPALVLFSIGAIAATVGNNPRRWYGSFRSHLVSCSRLPMRILPGCMA